MICGNGKLDYVETYSTIFADQCDDGNVLNNDGCSSSCTKETGWTCTRASASTADVCVPNCGDGLIRGNEVCDDGNTSATVDGCSTNCKSIDFGYICPTPAYPCIPTCGDGIKAFGEECDDGNLLNRDGCSFAC